MADNQKARIIVPDQRVTTLLPWNPDDIWRKRNSFDIYDEMLRDYQIKALIDLKKNLIIGSDYEIQAPRDQKGLPIKKTQEITDFVWKNINELYEGNFKNDLMQILDAMVYGFSLTEMMFEVFDNKIILKKLKPVPPNGIQFNIDEYGDILKTGGIQQRTRSGDIFLPKDKFVLYQWNKREWLPYGQSDLRAIYDRYFIKKEVTKFWAMFLERYGMPFAVVKYPPDLANQAAQMQDIVKQMQSSASAVIPEGLMLEMMDVSKAGGNAFEMAIKKLDIQISIGLQIPTLLGFTASDEIGGSYSLAEQQNQAFKALLKRYREEFENIISRQIIKKLVDVNFDRIPAYPTIVFKEVFAEDNLEKVKTFITLQQTGTFKVTEDQIQYALQELGFPASEIELIEEEEEEPMESEPSPNNRPENDNPEPGDDSLDSEDDASDTIERTSNNESKFKIIETSSMIVAEKTVNFEAINKYYDDEIELSTKKLSDILIKTKDQVIAEITSKKPLENDAFRYIENFKLPNETNGKLKTQFERFLNRAIKQGQNDASTEIERQSGGASLNFDSLYTPDIKYSAIKEWLKKFAQTKAFTLAGGLSDSLRLDIRNTLIEGMRTGKTTQDIVLDIAKAFEPYIAQNIVPGTVASPWRMETLVRTNINTFYNSGRMATYKTISKKAVPFFQYSAILDARTSVICTELHGTVLPADDPQLGNITPPRHFNCRSILLPITKYRVDDMNEGLQNGDLKEGLTKPLDFYDGFTSKTKAKKPE